MFSVLLFFSFFISFFPFSACDSHGPFHTNLHGRRSLLFRFSFPSFETCTRKIKNHPFPIRDYYKRAPSSLSFYIIRPENSGLISSTMFHGRLLPAPILCHRHHSFRPRRYEYSTRAACSCKFSIASVIARFRIAAEHYLYLGKAQSATHSRRSVLSIRALVHGAFNRLLYVQLAMYSFSTLTKGYLPLNNSPFLESRIFILVSPCCVFSYSPFEFNKRQDSGLVEKLTDFFNLCSSKCWIVLIQRLY